MPRYPVVLASASPRRQELLKELISEFRVQAADLDEEALTVSHPWQTAKALALAKAQAVAATNTDALVIGSDTVVALQIAPDQFCQFAKPRDRADAIRILTLLSGKTHGVITGLALVNPIQTLVEADTTQVRFRELTMSEIEAYVDTGEPMDKAGAYAIQGGASGFVERIEGSVSNVIGLPVELLERMLIDCGLRRES